MTENLITVQEEADLSKRELLQLACNAFEAAWLPRAVRDTYLQQLEAYASQ
jgi:adenosine deaminase